eukprot:TRINITY_DN2563_c1_g2_i1.p1 TRINITY_DN2563_c1_g2~~TRINITY_DN2563_c1_g2_i1.p1  ORF type:complete len:403 (+),score=178.68 TRINITY_DN2563_c1_g2_i1:70-1278(+)
MERYGVGIERMTGSPYGKQIAAILPDLDCCDDTFRGQMLACYNDDRFSDITFRFAQGGEVVFAHRVVLAARSPVMQQALSPNGEWANRPEVRLDESVDMHIFSTLLKYIYSSTAQVPYAQVHSVALLAHRFQVQGLVDCCEAYLGNNVIADNLLLNLEVAEVCNLERLKLRCTEKLQHGGLLSKMLEPESLRKVALPGLRALLSLEPLPIDEYSLFHAVLLWATSQIGEAMPPAPAPLSRGAAELCAPLMELIRFPTMNGKELRKMVKSYEVVPPARYIEALEHLADVDDDAALDPASPQAIRFRHRQGAAPNNIRRAAAAAAAADPTPHRIAQPAFTTPHTASPPPETPPRGLPAVSQMSAASPWQQQTAAAATSVPMANPSYQTSTPKYLPRSGGGQSAI